MVHGVSSPFAVASNGRRLYVLPGDARGEELARGGALNPQTLEVWRLLLRQSAWTHVFDIGANYGEMVLAADLPPDARCVAVEPNPAVNRMLSRSISEAGVAVDVLPYAVSDQPGPAVLNVDSAWSGTTSLLANPAQRPTTSVEVQCVTLASLFSTAGVTSHSSVLLKIDVEGHEGAVLRGAGDWPRAVANFAGLVEILHLAESDREWLLDQFDVGLYDPLARRIVQVGTPDARALVQLVSAGFYGQDVIIAAKSRARGFSGWR